MSNSYLGETDQKRLTRLWLYQTAAQVQPPTFRKDGLAVVLAGPEAGEVGCLKYLLGINPKKVLFVDEDSKGLEVAKRWRGVQTFHGDILDAITSINEPISFLNLDFTGCLTDYRKKVILRARSKLRDGAIVSYTFFRGREAAGRSNFTDILCTDAETLPEKRILWYGQTLQNLLGGNVWNPVGCMEYDARKGLRHSPMGVWCLQKMPLEWRGMEWRDAMERAKKYTTSRRAVITGSNASDAVRDAALSMLSKGRPNHEVQKILNIDPGTLRAWKAHLTRGTYAEVRYKRNSGRNPKTRR